MASERRKFSLLPQIVAVNKGWCHTCRRQRLVKADPAACPLRHPRTRGIGSSIFERMASRFPHNSEAMRASGHLRRRMAEVRKQSPSEQKSTGEGEFSRSRLQRGGRIVLNEDGVQRETKLLTGFGDYFPSQNIVLGRLTDTKPERITVFDRVPNGMCSIGNRCSPA